VRRRRWKGELLTVEPDEPEAGPVSDPGRDRPGHLSLLSTRELIHKVREGDRGALESLVTRFLGPLRRWASGRLPRRARSLIDTEDLVQDTLLRTLQRIDDLEPRRAGGFQSYLRQAIINRIRDELRRAATHPRPADEASDPQDPGPTPLQEALGRERLARYEEGLRRLKEEEREAILARFEMGFDYAQIAAALGKPSADAARMAVSRALLRLAEEVADE
jgi:RNA polymerase sigma-70 factor (ECF subfamily)